MRTRNKVIYGVSILLFLEAILYLWQGIHAVQFFFIVFTIVNIFALLINTIGISNNSYSRGNWQGHTMNGAPLGNVSITDDMIKPPEQKSSKIRVKKPSNMVLLITLIINIVCCVITVNLL